MWLQKIEHRVFVRQPVHRAGEDQLFAERGLRHAEREHVARRRGREVSGVDACRHDVDRPRDGARIEPRERVAIRVGHAEDAGETPQGLAFVSHHPAVLHAVEQASDRAGLRLRGPPPDLGLDVCA